MVSFTKYPVDMTGPADRLDVRGTEVVDLSEWKDGVFKIWR